ncbi:MAG: hypothetical protein ABJE10_22235 [bacterium]
MKDTGTLTTYYAPGLDMLLSNIFLDDHCFRLAAADGRIGIEFEPSPDRSRIPEIRGTLWVDRVSSELTAMEFGYVNVSKAKSERARGELRFARMRDGTWAITRWNIQMPVTEIPISGGSANENEARVLEVLSTGGELVFAQRGQDTIWSRPPLTLSGDVVDSSSGSAR